MSARKKKQLCIQDSLIELLSSREPLALDVEMHVLNVVLSGICEKEIFSSLDADCFCRPDHAGMFTAAKELYDEMGSVPYNRFCEKIGSSPEKVKEYFGDYKPSPAHLEFYIKLLQQFKLRRAVIWESVAMITKATDDNYNVDVLADDCENYVERVKGRGVMRIKDPNTVDWYALGGDSSAEKYLVRKGKNGWSDYCVVDNKFVSETQMFTRGFKRISLPIETKDA